MKPQTSLLLLLSAASLSLSTACSSSSSSKQETAQSTDSTQVVTVDAARLTELDSRQQYTAQLEAKTLNNITAQAGGRVKQILVAVGDRVAAGQVVARMEATQASAAQIQLADAKTNFARMDELYKVGGISKAQWEQAKSALEQAKLSYGNASENTLLRSPISGFVTAKNYDNGDVTSPAQPILVIQQVSPLKVVVNVSEQYYTRLKPGLEASLSVEALGTQSFSGRITKVYPTVDATTHTVGVEIEVPNKDQRLRPGMYARLSLDFGTRQALTISDKAIVRQAGSGIRYVYVLKEGKAVYREVELGELQDGRYEVLRGIEPGEQLIISAPSRLKNGTAVKLAK
ncbi:efflux RND transporter periplasmic adaptor subunit [uncultured Porphyromonas sp.]|uniref:efflux RND transporter periplasmic adaptor subunit n=1 Tax=uncultured Porphyromonas sp. TaxID=159274 RepID=UPI0026052D16|nr:efflux RND transporter periplasmic adaptor subunit [uncultured Porphyromonas sp.]